MPPNITSGAMWSESAWQPKQWQRRRNGAWKEKQWTQWTANRWQEKWTGCWWDADFWKADSSASWSRSYDGGASDAERSSDAEEKLEEQCPWDYCVAKEHSADNDTSPSRSSIAASLPDADELRALHEAALRSFLVDGDEAPGLDTEVGPSGASHPEQAAFPQSIPIHGTDARCAFYNPVTGGVDCQLCAMYLNSLKQWEDHRTGKKHVKKFNSNKFTTACEPFHGHVTST